MPSSVNQMNVIFESKILIIEKTMKSIVGIMITAAVFIFSGSQVNAQSELDEDSLYYYDHEHIFEELWLADDNSGYKMKLKIKGQGLHQPVECLWWSPNKNIWYTGEITKYDVIDMWFEIKSPVSGKTYTYVPNTKQGISEGYIGGEGEWGLEERSPDGTSRFYTLSE